MRRRSLLRGLAALAGVGAMPLLAGEARQDSVEQPRLNPADARLMNSHRRHWGMARGQG